MKNKKNQGKKSPASFLIFLAISVIALAAAIILIQKPQDTRGFAASACYPSCKAEIGSKCSHFFYIGSRKAEYKDIKCFNNLMAQCTINCPLNTNSTSVTRSSGSQNIQNQNLSNCYSNCGVNAKLSCKKTIYLGTRKIEYNDFRCYRELNANCSIKCKTSTNPIPTIKISKPEIPNIKIIGPTIKVDAEIKIKF